MNCLCSINTHAFHKTKAVVVAVVTYTQINPLSTPFTSNTQIISGQTPSFLNGTYVMSASTTWSGYLPYHAFNTYGGTSWLSAQTYTNSTGLYNGGTTTTVSGTSTLGEWIQLQIPSGKTMSSYTLYPDSGFNCSALKWTIAGSNDGSSWSLIDSQDFTSTPTYWSGKTNATFTVSSTSYAYYRFIGQAITPNGGWLVIVIPALYITVIT